MIIGWKAIAIFFGYEANEVEAFRKRAYRLGIQFPKTSGRKGYPSVFAYRDTLKLLKSAFRMDDRRPA